MENSYKAVQDAFIFHFQFRDQDTFFFSKVHELLQRFSNCAKKSRKSKQENAQEARHPGAMLRALSKFS